MEIIEEYHSKELSGKKIFDFIPFHGTLFSHVKGAEEGMTTKEIIDHWAIYFRSKKIPYVIAKRRHQHAKRVRINQLSLWKEKLTGDMANTRSLESLRNM